MTRYRVSKDGKPLPKAPSLPRLTIEAKAKRDAKYAKKVKTPGDKSQEKNKSADPKTDAESKPKPASKESKPAAKQSEK